METERDPTELRLHPMQKILPEPDKKSPEWRSFMDGLRGAGPDGIPAVFGTPDGQVMDGGWRLRGALILKWDRILYKERPEKDCAALMVESLLGAKKMTRGAAVYLALRVTVEFVASVEARRVRNIGKRNHSAEVKLSSNLTGKNSEESVSALCIRWGISRETYYRALEVQEVFEKDRELKAELEPQLLNGEKNLWNVLSYEGGSKADQSGRELGLLKSGLENLRRGAEAWHKLTREGRVELLNGWRKASADFHPTMRKALIDVLNEGGAA